MIPKTYTAQPQGLLYSFFDTYRHAQLSASSIGGQLRWVGRLGALICGFALSCGFFIGEVSADEVDEFDDLSDGWVSYPRQIGRSSESGWINVRNDREGSIRTSPATTRSTYYWKLTKVYDLSFIEAPTLDLKFHFKGYGYEAFKVMIGDENARRLSDFEPLYEQTRGTQEPQEETIDLSEYAGQVVKIQLLLKKPYDVVERRIGLYVHRVALRTPPEPITLHEVPNQLRIASFNIQVFGLSKMSNPEVVDALVEILAQFDLVLIQEIRDISETAVIELLDRLNDLSAIPFSMIQSSRLGRTVSKEQLAFFYRADKLSALEDEVVSDISDAFERPPYAARFEHLSTLRQFWAVGAHLDPDTIPEEISALYEAVDAYRLSLEDDQGLIVMGDLNADCRYLTETERAEATLFNSQHFTQLIDDEADTTTTSTHCAYDRIMINDAMLTGWQEAGVYPFDQELNLTGAQTRAVSDHYPVWMRLDLNPMVPPMGGAMAGAEGGAESGGSEEGGVTAGSEGGADGGAGGGVSGGAETGGESGGVSGGAETGGVSGGAETGGAETGGVSGGAETGGVSGGAETGGVSGGAEIGAGSAGGQAGSE